MGGGLMQLVAYGAQDIYLTGNPQITFFKVVYRRHTNFSMESIEQIYDGDATAGADINVTIARNGDLVHKLYLGVETNGSGRAPQNYGHSIIDFVELEIGGQIIDKLYGHWMEIWARLTQPNPTGNVGVVRDIYMNPGIDATFNTSGISGSGAAGTNSGKAFDSQLLRYPLTKFQQLTAAGGVASNHYAAETLGWNTVIAYASYSACNTSGSCNRNASGDAAATKTIPARVNIPIPFWFCRNPGLALPLIALQYHEVKVKFQFKSNVFPDTTTSSPVTKVWAEYIYLDTDERRRFAQISHEYLIEQVQREEHTINGTGSNNVTGNITLNLNHPVKELIIVGGWGDATSNTGFYGALPGIADKDTKVSLLLNSQDRFQNERDFYYFSRSQIWEHHTGPGNLYEGFEGLPGGPWYNDGYVTNGAGKARYGNWGPQPYMDDISTFDGYFGTLANPVNTTRADSIGVYSFALKPEEHQPSGTCNFSRIDSTELILKNLKTRVNGASGTAINTSINIVIYAINYNILRIMSGMGGLAYSN